MNVCIQDISRQGKWNLEGKQKTTVFSLLNFWRPAKQPVCLHWLDWLTSFWAPDDGNGQTHPCIWNRVPRTRRENACFTQCCTKCPKQLQAYTFLGHPKFQQCQVTMNSFRIMAVMEIVVAAVKTPNSCMEKTWHRPTAQTHAAPSNNAWILECIQFWPTMADLLFCLSWISSKSQNIPKFNGISMKIPSNLRVWSPDTLTPTQLLSMGSVTLGEAPAMLGPGALAVPGEAGREEPWRSTHQALHLTEMSAGMMTKYDKIYHKETKWSQIISDPDSSGWVSMFPYVFHMFSLPWLPPFSATWWQDASVVPWDSVHALRDSRVQPHPWDPVELGRQGPGGVQQKMVYHGLRENLNRKPWFLPSNWSGFPVKFPIIQFYDFSFLNIWNMNEIWKGCMICIDMYPPNQKKKRYNN